MKTKICGVTAHFPWARPVESVDVWRAEFDVSGCRCSQAIRPCWVHHVWIGDNNSARLIRAFLLSESFSTILCIILVALDATPLRIHASLSIQMNQQNKVIAAYHFCFYMVEAKAANPCSHHFLKDGDVAFGIQFRGNWKQQRPTSTPLIRRSIEFHFVSKTTMTNV